MEDKISPMLYESCWLYYQNIRLNHRRRTFILGELKEEVVGNPTTFFFILLEYNMSQISLEQLRMNLSSIKDTPIDIEIDVKEQELLNPVNWN